MTPEVFDHLTALADGYEKQGQTRTTQHYVRSCLAVLTYKVKQYERSKKLFDQLKNKIDRQAFRAFDCNLESCLSKVYAMTSPLAGEIKAAGKLVYEAKHDEALKALATIMEKAKSNEVRDYVNDLSYGCKVEKALATGHWVKLPLKDKLPGWTIVDGKWEVKNGVLVGSSDSGIPLILVDGRPGLEYEFCADMEIKRFGCTNGKDVMAVVDYDSKDWRTILVHTGYRQCRLYDQFYDNEKKQSIALKKKNSVRIVRQNNRLEVFINGVSAFSNVKLKGGNPADMRVGLGTRRCCRTNVVQFSNIKLRRLDLRPPEEDANMKDER